VRPRTIAAMARSARGAFLRHLRHLRHLLVQHAFVLMQRRTFVSGWT
jgi:hypothetical protein